MFMNTMAQALGCYPWKQLYLIALVDLVPAAAEKVSLIRSNTVWNWWKRAIHKGEPEPRNGNVNTVSDFIYQARANTRISRTEFMYDESMRLQMVTHI